MLNGDIRYLSFPLHQYFLLQSISSHIHQSITAMQHDNRFICDDQEREDIRRRLEFMKIRGRRFEQRKEELAARNELLAKEQAMIEEPAEKNLVHKSKIWPRPVDTSKLRFYTNVKLTSRIRSKNFQNQLFRDSFKSKSEIDHGLFADSTYPKPRPFTIIPSRRNIHRLGAVVDIRTTNSRCTILVKLKISPSRFSDTNYAVEHNQYWKFENASAILKCFLEQNPQKMKERLHKQLYTVASACEHVPCLKSDPEGISTENIHVLKLIKPLKLPEIEEFDITDNEEWDCDSDTSID